MWNFLKKMLLTRAGVRAAMGVGRRIGFIRFALLAGVLGGLRYLWQRRSTRYA
jgi:hypothetical protein